MPNSHEVTQILSEWRNGQSGALNRLLPLVYEELRHIAARHFGQERSDHTLQPTALVHEAFLRLVEQRDVAWQSRAHFLAVASTMMRRVLVDYARAHHAQRRGDGVEHVLLEDALNVSGGTPMDHLALEEALVRLEKLDATQARVVELRFFGGLSVEESAEVLNLGTATVKRYWNSARAFLYRELTRRAASDTGTVEPGPKPI